MNKRTLFIFIGLALAAFLTPALIYRYGINLSEKSLYHVYFFHGSGEWGPDDLESNILVKVCTGSECFDFGVNILDFDDPHVPIIISLSLRDGDLIYFRAPECPETRLEIGGNTGQYIKCTYFNKENKEGDASLRVGVANHPPTIF